MPRHFTLDLHFPRAASRLAALFMDPTFLEAESCMQGSFEAHCVEVERTGSLLRLRVDQVGPNRDPRSRAREARQSIHYTWDLKGGTCAWTRVGTPDDGIRIGGTHRALPEGSGCRYAMSWDVDVPIPLLGRVMEKRLEEGILEAQRKREVFVRDWLARES